MSTIDNRNVEREEDGGFVYCIKGEADLEVSVADSFW